MTSEVQSRNPVYVGELAYQLYRRTWQGSIIFGAQIGKPYVSKKTGEPMLLRSYDEKCLDDVMSAARAAKKQIAKMISAPMVFVAVESKNKIVGVLRGKNEKMSSMDQT